MCTVEQIYTLCDRLLMLLYVGLCKLLWIKVSDKCLSYMWTKLHCKLSLFSVMTASWNLAISWSTVWHCPERCPWFWLCLVLVLPSDWLSTSMMFCIADAASAAPTFEPCCRIKISQRSLLKKYTQHPWMYYVSSPRNYKVLFHIFVKI